jgi:hypothetical protein
MSRCRSAGGQCEAVLQQSRRWYLGLHQQAFRVFCQVCRAALHTITSSSPVPTSPVRPFLLLARLRRTGCSMQDTQLHEWCGFIDSAQSGECWSSRINILYCGALQRASEPGMLPFQLRFAHRLGRQGGRAGWCIGNRICDYPNGSLVRSGLETVSNVPVLPCTSLPSLT